jgi:hypothetical protein
MAIFNVMPFSRLRLCAPDKESDACEDRLVA